MIGERIGHLRVIASIGVGGMGAVWHAVDELLDRHVALKVIRPELMSRPGLAERFRSEAIVLARLQHPCIAALYGLEKRGDEFVMVMEYVDGQTLDTRVAQQGVLPWPEATRITRAVLDALDHAHESGVIHRDIKPANVMITRAGRVKVMDFGIARLVGAQRQTRTGAAVGTPSYMSPEQLLGQEVDGRADVYAVGTLLYELTTGHLPFEVEGDYLRMIAQLQQIPALPSTHRSDLPAGLDVIIARALQKEPDDRYATSGEFRDALEELEREHGVLRPYGTPAAGSAQVPGSGTSATRGTPANAPAVAPQAAPNFSANSAALLTPADAAMSVTPVPFAVEPAGATPIDLSVPGEPVAAAASSPEPQPASMAAAPTPEFSSASVGEVTAPAPEAPRRSALPRGAMAAAAIAVVVAAGVMINRGLSRSESAAAVAADSAPIVTVAPPPPAPAQPAPPTTPVSAAPADSVDSAAVKKAIADSLRLARRAARDSARRVADSIAAASVFALPAAGTSGQSVAEEKLAEQQGAAAMRECVSILSGQNVGTIGSRFGRDNRNNILRIAVDNRLTVGQALRITHDVNDGAGSVQTRANVLLGLKDDTTAGRSFPAQLRSVTEKKNGTWSTPRCFIDNDGGIRP
jgi:eukaryotic-like serine/threonine-protein kinase